MVFSGQSLINIIINRAASTVAKVDLVFVRPKKIEPDKWNEKKIFAFILAGIFFGVGGRWHDLFQSAEIRPLVAFDVIGLADPDF